MEPSTRPYNPNRQRATHARGSDSAKLSETAPEPKKSGATPASSGGKSRARRASEKRGAAIAAVATAESSQTAPESLVESSDVATTVQSPRDEAIAKTLAEEQGAELVEPGPLVGVDDFDDLFTRFQTPITNFIYRLVGNREQAYDLAQDVFVKAYRALSGGATIQAGALSSWLYRIASNTATDALRRRRLISWLPLSLFNDDRGVGAGMPGSDNGFSQQTLSEEHLASAMGAFTSGYDGGRFEQRVADREIVERVLQRLPEKYAACLLLYEHEGFSCAEIADVLHVTPSAVKMRLMRARERFISIYQQEMEGRR